MGRKPTLENEVLDAMLNFKKQDALPTFAQIKEGYATIFNKPLSDGALAPSLQRLMAKGTIRRFTIQREGSIRGEIRYQLSNSYFNNKLKAELSNIMGNPGLKMDLRVHTAPLIGVNTTYAPFSFCFNHETEQFNQLAIKQFTCKLFKALEDDGQDTLIRTPLLLAWAGKQIGNLDFIAKEEAHKKLSEPYRESFVDFLKYIQTEDGRELLMLKCGKWLQTALTIFGFEKEIEEITSMQSTYAWLRLFDYIVGAAFYVDSQYEVKLAYHYPTLTELKNYMDENHDLFADFLVKANDIKFMFVVYFGFSQIDDTESLEEIDSFEKWLIELKEGNYDDNSEIFDQGLGNVQKIRMWVKQHETELKGAKNIVIPSKFDRLCVDEIELRYLLKYYSEGTTVEFWRDLEEALQERKALIRQGKGKTKKQIIAQLKKEAEEEYALKNKKGGLWKEFEKGLEEPLEFPIDINKATEKMRKGTISA